MARSKPSTSKIFCHPTMPSIGLRDGWARRLLPGRDGLPGADYNTWPAFKPPGIQLLTSNWRQGDAGYVRLIDDGLGEGRIDAAMTLVLARRFWLAWQCEGPSRSAACDGEQTKARKLLLKLRIERY